MSDWEEWERDYHLRALDDYLDGGISYAAKLLSEDKTSSLFGYIRDQLAGVAGEKHERKNGLLTPENEADRVRREAIGRQAAAAAEFADQFQPRLEMKNPDGAPASCVQNGRHTFGQLRGPNGEAECTGCGVMFVFPK